MPRSPEAGGHIQASCALNISARVVSYQHTTHDSKPKTRAEPFTTTAQAASIQPLPAQNTSLISLY